MISLHDEISKFEKMVYNKELAQYVTVDQMFVGGGITIESIIHENSFMIEELKKMNAVFRNFCKLNEKVYTKIMEHELSIHNQQTKFSGLASSIDRKFDDTAKIIKDLYEGTVLQNQKSLRTIQEVLKPIKSEIEKKVDETTFMSKMKHILDEYDEGGLNEQQKQNEQMEYLNDKSNQQINAGNNTTTNVASPLKKGQQLTQQVTIHKKGKVGFDQFYKMKEQLQVRLKACEGKMTEINSEGVQTKQMVVKYIPIINQASSDIYNQANNIQKINFEQTEKIISINNSINKLHVQLNDRINENIWTSKFQAFNAKQVKPAFKCIQQNMALFRIEVKENKLENMTKFQDIQNILTTTNQKISNAHSLLKRNKEQIDTINCNIKENQKINQRQFKIITNKMEETSTSLQNTIKSVEIEMKKNFGGFKETIDNLSNSITQMVVKAVNKKIATQLKMIEKDIQQNRLKIKQIKEDSMILCEQIKNIKEVLANKANFSDIIQHVEKKADKEDFKELKLQLNEGSQQLLSSRNINESFNLSKMEKVESIRRVHSTSRNAKTMFGHQTPNKLDKLEPDSSTKLFMCGFDEHIGENKRVISQNSRRHRLKSSHIASEFA